MEVNTGFFFTSSEVLVSSYTTYLTSNTIANLVSDTNLASTKYYWANKTYIPSNADAAATETNPEYYGNPALFTATTSWVIGAVFRVSDGLSQLIPPGKLTNGYDNTDENSPLGPQVQNFFESNYTVFLIPEPDTTEAEPPCFLAGAIVETDQGHLPIETINPAVNTIGGKRIVAITANNPASTKMVRLIKNIIAPNVPDKDTDITHSHNVLYQGKFRCASMVPGLRYRPYKGETLYNVLMETHDTMKVNNMIVKTLPPDHPAARHYRK